MNITVRKAQIQDIPSLLVMNEALQDIAAPNGPAATVEWMTESLENNKNEIVLVAIHNGKAIGFACGLMYRSVCYSDGLQGELTELYVCSEYRKKGVATNLVEQVEREFARNNVHDIIIKTGIENKAAQRVYESCGYEDYEEVVYHKEI